MIRPSWKGIHRVRFLEILGWNVCSVLDDKITMLEKDPNSKESTSGGEAPFEWLTSPLSLDPFLQRITFQRALHVGCGSSRFGEHLVERWDASSVVNVDVDKTILEKVQNRWKERCGDEESRMKFVEVDYANAIAIDDTVTSDIHGPFDLIVDKSTLDCLLCTEAAAANLLHHVYNSLNGVYLLVSFQHRDLLLPLLEGLGHWNVEIHVLKRQMEGSRIGSGQELGLRGEVVPSAAAVCEGNFIYEESSRTQWSSGTFEPDSKYHEFVNVVLCHKDGDSTLPLASVKEHVRTICNQWWTQINPILSSERIEQLRSSFGDAILSLPEAYEVLFTEAEKEHLGYSGFLEDWLSFVSTRDSLSRDRMDFGTAVDFLDEVQ